MVSSDASQLYKGDVVVGYAKAFIVIGSMIQNDVGAETPVVAADMVDWLEQAAEALDDPEIEEMAQVMDAYRVTLEQQF
jgi:hypothetical protein